MGNHFMVIHKDSGHIMFIRNTLDGLSMDEALFDRFGSYFAELTEPESGYLVYSYATKRKLIEDVLERISHVEPAAEKERLREMLRYSP